MKKLLGKLGLSKTKALEVHEEEQVQSPMKTIMKTFLSRRLTQVGLFLFGSILLAVLILPIFFPLNMYHQDVTQQNVRPGFGMMRYPRHLSGNVRQISAGANWAVGVSDDGNVYVWGFADDDLLAIPQNMGNVLYVSAGHEHALALNDQGEVFTWGDNTHFGSMILPYALGDIPGAVQRANIVAVQAGFQISSALDDQGNLFIWGNTLIFEANTRFLEGAPVAEWDLAQLTALALTQDGYVKSLAANRHFPINEFPDEIQGRTVALSTSDRQGAALLDDGTVVMWGEGIVHTPEGTFYTIAEFEPPAHIQGRVTAIDSGRDHFTVILDDGTVYSFGENHVRQANHSRRASNIEQIAIGFFQNYAIDADGNIYTWGLNGYVFGTDGMGRDVFLRVITGGRFTLSIGAVAVIISTTIGILLGSLAGYFGGRLDMFLMRLAEVFSSIPFLPFAMILTWVIGSSVGQTGRILVIMVVLGLLSWPGIMRLTRGQMLQARENDYVMAARSLGVRERKIIFKHIFPNIIAMLIVSITLSLAGSMLIESGLSFLGFGIFAPQPTWGNMLNDTINSVVIREYWWRWVFPGAFLFISVLSVNVIGDGLREAIDPKAQER